MTRSGVMWVFMILALLLESGSAAAARQCYTFPEIDRDRPLTLDFATYRIRVDGWERDYVEVEVIGRAKSQLIVTGADNVIRFWAAEFKQPLYEPAFRIKVPRSLPVTIVAGEAWARDCTIAGSRVRTIYVRECALPEDYLLRAPDPWARWPFLRRRDGWLTVHF